MSLITMLAFALPAQPGLPSGARPALKLEPVKLEVAEVWSLCTKAYAKPVHERLLITAKQEKQTRTSELIFRSDPGKAPDRADASMLIELSPLRVYIASGNITVISSTHEGTFAEQKVALPLTSLSLEPLVPALPLAQLCALAPLKADAPMAIASYASDIAWSGASVSLDDPAAPIIMLGKGKHASARLQLDQRTGRMRALTLELAAPAALTIDIAITPVEATDVASWKPEVSKRTKVPSLSHLVRKPDVAPEPAPPAADSKPAPETKPPAEPTPAPPAEKPKR